MRYVILVYVGETSQHLSTPVREHLNSDKKSHVLIHGGSLAVRIVVQFYAHQHRRQILICWQRNHRRMIPTNSIARIRSKNIENHILVVKIVLSF